MKKLIPILLSTFLFSSCAAVKKMNRNMESNFQAHRVDKVKKTIPAKVIRGDEIVKR